MRIQFGQCTFDAVRRQVRRGGVVVHLSPKGFELLRLLVANRPRAMAKEELFERLWPEVVVSEASLAGLVAEIRRSIGEDAREPRFLRTVHGFGYAFSDGATAAADEDAVFRLIWGARELPLADGENVLGRDPEAAVRIDDATVSRHHARIVIEGGCAALEDLGSKNGTWLRGQRIGGSAPLCDGDAIQVGPAAMVFRCYPSTGSTQTHVE
ncbi:MAG: FHA domain-containing protein [Acidobacteriota bacterium]